MTERYLPLPGLPAWLDGFVTTCGAVAEAYGGFNLALHVGDAEDRVLSNRASLLADWQLQGVQWLEQVHSTTVVQIGPEIAPTTPVADGMWSAHPGPGLGILTADCVPVVIWCHDTQRYAALHAGWKGLADGIVDVGLSALGSGSKAAVIGPCVSAAHYEVGADVWQQFATHYALALADHPQDQDKRLLDLRSVARAQLERRSVQVSDLKLCTYSDARLYSHRRARHLSQGQCGRFATVVFAR